MLKINGVTVVAPSVFQVDISDLDGDGANRNANGEMIRDRVAVKRKITLEWGALEDFQISGLLSIVSDVFFQVTYPDPMDGGMVTKTFYVGDRSAPLYNFKMNLWSGLKMNFVEK
ncbi:MAG: DUF6711 family protein [Sarcina sp.]